MPVAEFRIPISVAQLVEATANGVRIHACTLGFYADLLGADVVL